MNKLLKILFIFTFFTLLVSCQQESAYLVEFYAESSANYQGSVSQVVKSGEKVKEPIEPVGETEFLYWYNFELDLIWKFDEYTVEDNMELYAVYAAKNNYFVNLNFNTGRSTSFSAYEGEIPSIEIPTRNGYEFLGWYEGDVLYDLDQPITRTINLEARWKSLLPEKETHQVNFKVDSEIIHSVTVKNSEKVTEPNDPTKLGHKFVGWYFNNSLYDFNYKLDSDITLEARFEELEFKLTIPESVNVNIDNLDIIPYNTEITLTVNVPNNKEIALFKVNGININKNPYTFKISEDTLVDVSFKDIVLNEITYKEDFTNLANWKEQQDWGTVWSSYESYTYTSNGFDFDLVNARVDLGMYEGDQGVTLRGTTNPIDEQGRGWIMLEDFSDGLSAISFTARLPYSPNSTYPQGPGNDKAINVKISIYVNEEKIHEFKFADDKSANKGETFTLFNLNFKGLTTFRIEVSSGHRLTIGEFLWTTNKNGQDELETLKLDFEGSKFVFDQEETIHEFAGLEFVLKEVHTDSMHPEKEKPYMTAENGSVVARFRGESDHWASTPTAYIYNVEPFETLRSVSFDAKQFGSEGYFAPNAEVNIYKKLAGEESFTLIETISNFNEETYQNYSTDINSSNVVVKIEVIKGTLNLDNIIFTK